jgi:hypothetical protein
MPVTIAKRFIVDFPFSAGPQGPLRVIERAQCGSFQLHGPVARETGGIGKLRAKLAVGYWMQQKFYLLQRILFSFCILQELEGEVPAIIG